MSQALMQHPDISLILATGGPAMVRAAYASSHPAIGVGAGNTPAVMDDTCDVKMAVSSVLISKTFDNGVICASEQSVVVMDKIYEEVKKEFQLRGAYFLTPEEVAKVGPQIIKDGRLNANIVGQSAEKLGSMFGLNVPKGTKVLIGEVKEIGASEPFAYEKLCPILGMYRAGTYDEAVSMADKLIQFGGPGHTSVLYTDPRNTESIAKFNSTVKTARILINTPASQGAIGDLYNFHMDPSLTLGCGTWGSTSVSTNVGPQHLLNVKTVGERRQNMLWFRVPSKIYFKGGSLEVALRELSTKHRVFVVTDKPLYDIGVANKVTDVLDEMGVKHQVYYQVEPDPTIANIERGVHEINQFQPDAIVAIGGGSPMDAAKVMWMMYEQPQVKFEGVAMRFMDIRKRVYELPELGAKAQLICVPTTSGTGSEVTPFAVVTDQNTGVKYPLADYALTPSMAIVDPQLVMSMPKKLTAYGGVDALTHALESYVSVCATDYTRALSKEAISSLFKYLPRAYHDGKTDYEAREKVHYAATIAGMAFANAFLGICHSLAHKLGSNMHIPHGLANAALISHVVKYNATDAPYKQATFSQYEYPRAKRDYAEIAEYLGLCAKDASDEEKVKALVKSIEDLKAAVEIPPTIREICGAEREGEYMAKLDDMSDNAFDDQCTGANPRYPLINDLRQLLLDAWDKPIMSLL
jgi:acetaldehyde dehydrogenase/alcohol dehydrogenase